MAIKLTATDFRNSTADLLDNLNDSLTALSKNPANEERIHQCYLGWHKLKNLAAIFDFADILDIAHKMEALFFPEHDNEPVKLSTDEIAANLDNFAYIQKLIQNKIEDKTFQAKEPVTSNDTPAAGTKKPVSTTAASVPYRVLIIDDEPINTALLENYVTDLLTEDNVEIITVNSAAEGLFHFFTKKISIVFLDIMMPIIDGNDFIAIVEKNMYQKNITHDFKIIIQTAIQSISELVDFAQKECVHEIIRKPVTKIRVKECLERYCPLH